MQVFFLQALMYPKGFFCYGKEEQMKHYANKNPKDNAALRKNALNIAISYAKNIFFAFFFQLHPPPTPVFVHALHTHLSVLIVNWVAMLILKLKC